MLRIFTNFREILRVKVGYLQSWGQKMQNILQKAHATALLAVFFFFLAKIFAKHFSNGSFLRWGFEKKFAKPPKAIVVVIEHTGSCLGIDPV